VAYIVERYIPGLVQSELERALERLKEAAKEAQREGIQVQYLGSTIVLKDEACFCQFEAPSEADVVEVNRRAGIPFDRIVPAVPVPAAPLTERGAR
jgi:hypothetical protein